MGLKIMKINKKTKKLIFCDYIFLFYFRNIY